METIKKEKNVNVYRVGAWVFGILLFLSGLGNLERNLITGLFLILASLVLIPTSYDFIKTKFKLNLTRGVRVMVVILIAFVVPSFAYINDIPAAPVTESKNTKQVTPVVKEKITMSAIALYDEFESNAVAAEEKYKDKTLVVTGTIASIDRDIMDTPYITFAGDNPYITILQCAFNEREVSSISTLSKGETVTVEGELSGDLFYPLLRKCVIVNDIN